MITPGMCAALAIPCVFVGLATLKWYVNRTHQKDLESVEGARNLIDSLDERAIRGVLAVVHAPYLGRDWPEDTMTKNQIFAWRSLWARYGLDVFQVNEGYLIASLVRFK